MKHSLLLSFISTLAFSFGLVGASPDLNVKRGLQIPIHDAMGIASNHIVCRKHAMHRKDSVYSKREAYAAVAQAMMLTKQGNKAIVGCESLKICSRYPKKFLDERIKFKTPGPFFAYPLLSNGLIFHGGHLPVSDLVIFDSEGDVAGIVYAGLNGYTKCLLDDHYVQGPQTISEKLKYQINYHRGKSTAS